MTKSEKIDASELWSTSINEVFQCASLFVCFGITMLFDRHIWLSVDVMVSFGFGAVLVEGEIQSLHLQLAQFVGYAMISSSIVFHLTYKSRDGTVPLTLLASRILSCSVMLVSMIIVQWTSSMAKPRFNKQHVLFGMTGVLVWLLGSVVHSFQSLDFSTYPQHNIRLNRHLRLDGVLVVVASLIFLAFPEVALNVFTRGRQDTISLHLTRLIGVPGLGSAFISFQAPGFLHEKDKQAQFIGRILGLWLVFPLMCFQAMYWNNFTGMSFAWAAVLTIPMVTNAVLGYMSAGHPIYTPRSSAEKNISSGDKNKAE